MPRLADVGKRALEKAEVFSHGIHWESLGEVITIEVIATTVYAKPQNYWAYRGSAFMHLFRQGGFRQQSWARIM